MPGPLVVCVEDDIPTLEMIGTFLPLEGFAVIGLVAPLPLMFRNAPDILLLDIMLQGTSGIEYAQTLRKDGVTCPLVAMSASRGMEAAARKSGLFADVIAKPFDYWDMVRRLRALLP